MSSVSKTFSLVHVHLVDGVAELAFHRPEVLNALNPALVFQLQQAFRQAIGDDAVRGVILRGEGRAFLAGADVSFFLRNLESGDVTRIHRFTEAGHQLLDEIDASPKPVVACVHGVALGGGLELALACDRIFAAPQAALGFPETGIGLYPGLGGTQRTLRRIGPGLAKWLIYTARISPAADAAALGLIDRVASPEELLSAARQAIVAGLPPIAAPERSAEFTALERFFLAHRVADLLAARADTQGDPRLVLAVKRVSTKAPLALGWVERFIDEGKELPLAAALQLELAHLDELFHTADAREGLDALTSKRLPVFQGR
jgi:enoyl-CoA hydratase/3-hydroxyacyl-CoA dehydrogenase